MDKYLHLIQLKVSTFSTILLVLIFCHAEIVMAEQPPIPPQRPKIFHVSPEYIKKLMEDRHIKTKPRESELATSEEIIPPTEPEEIIEKNVSPNIAIPVNKEKLDKASIQETTRQEVLDILDGRSKRDIPIPPDRHENKTLSEPEKTLISFSLKPEEVTLDENILNFLKDHALKLFNKNNDFTMEINAYATPVPHEEHSANRLSLARSLAVRKWLMDNNVSPSRLRLNHTRENSEIQTDDRIDLILVQ